MKRLFFLVPNLKETTEIAHELEHEGIKESHIHVHASFPEEVSGVHLHPANVLQTTHLGVALHRGIYLGIVFSIFILVLFKLQLPPNSITALGYSAMLLFGVIFGLWTCGMIGISVKDPVIEKYENYIKEGHYIMLVDAPDEMESALNKTVIEHHPHAALPNFRTMKKEEEFQDIKHL